METLCGHAIVAAQAIIPTLRNLLPYVFEGRAAILSSILDHRAQGATMQILLITDIHANARALQAVLDRYGDADEVWCLGDLVEYGPCPSQCIDLAREHCDAVVLGNHDARYASEDPAVFESNVWGFDRSPDHIQWLGALPKTLSRNVDGISYHLVHATPQDPLRGTLWPHSESAEFTDALETAGTDRVLCGHTHMAFIHDVDGRRLVNAGTIGQPRDGDYRAQCMLIEDGEIRFDRVEYDLDALRRDYAQSPLPQDTADTWFDYTRRGVVDVHGLQLGPYSSPTS